MGFRQFVSFPCFGRSCKEAPLAQLDRASGYEPEGREFESLRAHHTNKSRLSISLFQFQYLLRRIGPGRRVCADLCATQVRAPVVESSFSANLVPALLFLSLVASSLLFQVVSGQNLLMLNRSRRSLSGFRVRAPC